MAVETPRGFWRSFCQAARVRVHFKKRPERRAPRGRAANAPGAGTAIRAVSGAASGERVSVGGAVALSPSTDNGPLSDVVMPPTRLGAGASGDSSAACSRSSLSSGLIHSSMVSASSGWVVASELFCSAAIALSRLIRKRRKPLLIRASPQINSQWAREFRRGRRTTARVPGCDVDLSGPKPKGSRAKTASELHSVTRLTGSAVGSMSG